MGRRLTLAAFIAAVALQAFILVGVPARKLYTRAIGQTVFLQVVPVDPYSVLSGYYAILSFEVNRPEQLAKDGGAPPPEGQVRYVVIERGPDGAWHPVDVVTRKPGKLPPGRLFLRGRVEGWRGLRFGIEEFYIPEERRDELAEIIRKDPRSIFAEVKVDREGRAALVRLHSRGRIFR